jgi:hypothetical protein
LANVRSIAERGILSRAAAHRFKPINLAAQEMQDRRAPKRIPGSRPLHKYMKLYLHSRNPMLYK